VIGDKEGNPQNKLRDPPLLVHQKLKHMLKDYSL
jgi:hypothetical protein